MKLPQEILVLDALVEQIEKCNYVDNSEPGHRMIDNKVYHDAKMLVADAKDTPCSVMDSQERVSLQIGGVLHGFIQEGETKQEARGRMLLEAETCINEHYHLRAHIGVGGAAHTEKGTRLLEGRKDWHIVDVNGKIPPDEPVVTFRANDTFMPSVLEHYLSCIAEPHSDGSCAKNIENQLKRVHSWQKEHGCKTPDAPLDMISELTDAPVDNPDTDPAAE